MKTILETEDTDKVLELLRMLPPRERLRVVVEVLPELADDLPATSASSAFWQGADMLTLAKQQGVQQITGFESLLGGWPEDEGLDGFLAALDDWRQESLVGNSDQ